MTKSPSDADAMEIGNLYRKAQEALGESTPPLQVRETSPKKFRVAVSTPPVCHWCGDPFQPPKRKRFGIMDGCNHSGGWGLVSICFECFKKGWDSASRVSGISLDRRHCECNGCGEPISIPYAGKFTGSWPGSTTASAQCAATSATGESAFGNTAA
jgi:hypothetical protein